MDTIPTHISLSLATAATTYQVPTLPSQAILPCCLIEPRQFQSIIPVLRLSQHQSRPRQTTSTSRAVRLSPIWPSRLASHASSAVRRWATRWLLIRGCPRSLLLQLSDADSPFHRVLCLLTYGLRLPSPAALRRQIRSSRVEFWLMKTHSSHCVRLFKLCRLSGSPAFS